MDAGGGGRLHVSRQEITFTLGQVTCFGLELHFIINIQGNIKDCFSLVVQGLLSK